MMKPHLLMRIPVPWVFLLAYFLGVVLQGYLPSPEPRPALRAIAHVAGFALLAVGAALAVTCLVMFRKARTTTIPGQESSRLVTNGPYASAAIRCTSASRWSTSVKPERWDRCGHSSPCS